ncbi:MAG: Clp protease [Candidatus Marinimicrobia bacterium CG08_land_8_20_14_0_20_45_22]|nr:MAG: Clp protease [Candidatus Marinimicrobia bacterium CG08_land_8_20_14_0_20_45_22]
MNRAVFLDRDGTLNADSRDYIKNLDEFRLFPFTIKALKILSDLEFRLVIITNQACIAKGLTTVEKVQEIHEFITKEFRRNGINLDGIFYCPHHPDISRCECRKPKIANVLKAANAYEIDLSQSWFIGDSKKDVEAGVNAGCRTILVKTGVRETADAENWDPSPEYITENLLTAAQLIKREKKGKSV